MEYRCLNGHDFESIENDPPRCPTCGVSARPVEDFEEDPPAKQDDEPTTSVLDDLAVIDSILAESSTAEATEASVPDAGGFSGFDGGDSGGAGASDSFDGGSADTASV